MTAPGPHLLGRKPNPPDGRDWKGVEPLRAIKAEREAKQPSTVEVLEKILACLEKVVDWLIVGPTPQPTPDPTPTPAPTEVLWTLNTQLDQGDTGHCVGFGMCSWGNAAPVMDSFDNADAHAVYYECKAIDGEPKAEDGTYVRSGAKAMQKRKRLLNYSFLTSVAEVIDWVHNDGPVVIGSNWYDGMFDPDKNGVVTISGSIAGGHCYTIIGHNPAAKLFEFDNSWGTSWGKGGRAFMSESTLARLLSEDGEAMAALEVL